MCRDKIFDSLLLLTLCVSCFAVAHAQSRPQASPLPTPPHADKQNSDSDDKPSLGTLEDEMRVKREIKYREKEYEENISRAREAAEIGVQLRDSYKQHKSLSRDDAKRLDRLEKLTKRIRNEAGGSDEDVEIESPPQQLEPVLTRLADETDCLKSTVEKTPRQVVSTTVIEKANVLLKLIRLARSFMP